MVPSIIQGRVVYPKIAIPDPQGKNPKPGRPFVVVTKNDDIRLGDRIQAVGITRELDLSSPDHYVILPSGRNCRTGLASTSAALCTWLVDIAKRDVDFNRGHVDADLIEEIIAKLVALNAQPRVIPEA